MAREYPPFITSPSVETIAETRQNTNANNASAELIEHSGHYPPQILSERLPSIIEAVRGNNPQTILEAFRDPNLTHTLRINRGRKDANLFLLWEGMDRLVQERFGPNVDILAFDDNGQPLLNGAQVVEFLHEFDLPESLLYDLLSVAFHLRSPERFYRILALTVQGIDGLREPGRILPWIKHDLASWEASVNRDAPKAVAINKHVLGDSRKTGQTQPHLGVKAALGIALSKELSPKDKIIELDRLAVEFDKAHNPTDGIRARIEAARFRLELAARQKGRRNMQSERDANFGEARKLLESALQLSEEIGYSNGQLRALPLAQELYAALGLNNDVGRVKNKLSAVKRSALSPGTREQF